MGLAASLTYNLTQRETIVIGFKRMLNGDTAGHTGKNIKLTIESSSSDSESILGPFCDFQHFLFPVFNQ